jgi:hypothetical protein
MDIYQIYKLDAIAKHYNELQYPAGLQKAAAGGLLYWGTRILGSLPKMLRHAKWAKNVDLVNPLAHMKGGILKGIESSGRYGKAFVHGVHNAQYANRARHYTQAAVDSSLDPTSFIGKVKHGIKGAVKGAGDATKAHNVRNIRANPYTINTLNPKANFGEKMAYQIGKYINPNHYSQGGRLFLDTLAPLPFVGGSILGLGSGGADDASYAPAYANATRDAYMNGQYYGDPRNYDMYF